MWLCCQDASVCLVMYTDADGVVIYRFQGLGFVWVYIGFMWALVIGFRRVGWWWIGSSR